MKKGQDYIGVGCGAFIINKNNEILLTKRSENCRNKAGFRSIPGGGVELFETLEEGLKREVKEEVGVEIEIIKLLTITDDIIPEENQHWVAPQFECRIIGGKVKNLEPHKFE